MKNVSVLAGAALLLLVPAPISSQTSAPQPQSAQSDRTPVIVELFTSEGCSTCPPADALLSKLEAAQPVGHAEIIGFEEHVDYWNQDGWVDPFSSGEWTVRQREYVDRFHGDSPYTPQMVVDGQSQFVGNNAKEALASITAAANQAAKQVEIKAQSPDGNSLRYDVRVSNTPGNNGQQQADVLLAIIESGLGMDVKAGENAGKSLHHGAILRSMHKIGSISGKDSTAFTASPEVKLKSDWKKENVQVVVFVQERKSLKILGAAATRVAS